MDHQPPSFVASQSTPGRPVGGRRASGSRLVIGLLLLGVVAGVTGIWYQRGQTRRCLAFYGVDVARSVAAAPRVEVWSVPRGFAAAAALDQSLLLDPVGVVRRDVSAAPGLVHMRRGLVEDANFVWPVQETVSAVSSGGGATAIVFSDPADNHPPAVLLIELGMGSDALKTATGRHGGLEVIGRPGWIGLGRIAAGLEKWLERTAEDR